jgi:predicted nucleotidyltransferase
MSEAASPIVQTLERYFAGSDAGVVAVYLFGSHGRGEPRPDSDVDVGLLFREAPAARLGGPADTIAGELESLLGRPVEAIPLNSAPVDLIHRVLRDGVLVCERDRSARVAFEVRARREYFDLLPVLRLYRRGRMSAA